MAASRSTSDAGAASHHHIRGTRAPPRLNAMSASSGAILQNPVAGSGKNFRTLQLAGCWIILKAKGPRVLIHQDGLEGQSL
jgi:hypothetical protein